MDPNHGDQLELEGGLKQSPDKNIRDLPGSITLKVKEALDYGSIDNISAWRAFAAKLKGRFHVSGQDVERFAQQLHSGGSPTNQMVLELGAKGMVAKDLVHLLHQLRLENVLTHLVHNVEPTIVLQPEQYVKVRETEQLTISTHATGFPYPRYLWHRYDPETEGSVPTCHTQQTLIIECARVNHSGDYCCLVYNSQQSGKFTDWCSVTVQHFPLIEPAGQFNEGCSPAIPPMTQVGGKIGAVYTLPVIVQQPWTVNVKLDGDYYLLCEARGHLPLSYTWLHNGRAIRSSETGYMQVPKAKLTDDGVYQCEVRNQFGVVKSDCVKVSIANNEWGLFEPEPMVPEIQSHPKSLQVQLGGDALFRCVAHGMGALKYQWFKDQDSIPGATESEHVVYNVNTRSMQGVYMCLVTNQHSGHVLSKGAMLQIGEVIPRTNHFATGKLALLIGNYDYRSQQSLKAPQTDIQNLSHIFQRVLGFQVVSLLNLTLTEMTSAVEEFCELIDSGVYCVFYFCGHGFDENNQSYILPNDVPTDFKTEECLSAEYVLYRMQQQRPKVCCMILDICRKPSENPNQYHKSAILERTPVEDGNTVVCYATSCGLAAFESRPQSKGILVTHLEKLLPEPISIEEVFRKVKEAVGLDPRVNRDARTRQIPEIRSNLIEVHRSFTDPVETSGHTRATNKRQQAWEYAHVKPPPMEVRLKPEDLGVVVELTFQHEFSNVLSVFIKVVQRGHLPDCTAWISKLPSSVSMMKRPACIAEGASKFTTTKNVIIDIQKLKDNLRVSLAMRYRLEDSSPGAYIISKDTQIDLQLPLVAGLKLWHPRQAAHTPSTRHAVEQNEDEKTDT